MKANKTINQTERKSSHLGFGFYDEKCREIGMRATTWEFDLISCEPVLLFGVLQSGELPNFENGHYFAVRTQATRNGDCFGASQQPKYFKTLNERDLYLAKRWKDSLMNASKL